MTANQPLSVLKNRDVIHRRGFTMMELLLVVVLLSVVAALAVPNFSQTYKAVLFKKSVDDLVYSMRYAQSRAINQQRLQQLQFNQDLTQYQLLERSENSQDDFPNFVTIASRRGKVVTVSDGVKVSSSKTKINFFPDGSIDKVRIYFALDDQTYTISTQEQRGHIHLLDFRLEGT